MTTTLYVAEGYGACMETAMHGKTYKILLPFTRFEIDAAKGWRAATFEYQQVMRKVEVERG